MADTARVNGRIPAARVQNNQCSKALHILETDASAYDLSYCIFVVFDNPADRDKWLTTPCAHLRHLIPAQCIEDGLVDHQWFARVLNALNAASQSKKFNE